MKRSEEAALKEYPMSTPPSYIDGHDLLRQEAFIKGYEQAEEDLALTWQDIAKIITIYEQELDERIINRYGDVKNLQPYCERILKKFNELKQKK